MKVNKLGEEGTYTFTLNSNLESVYSNKKLPQFFIIQEIKVWNKIKKEFESLQLHILEGMLAGFVSKSKFEDLDLNKFDISWIREKHFDNQEKNELINILKSRDERYLKHVDLNNTFKIEINNSDFYVLKNIKNGNYISIDKDGFIYNMTHDPYKVEKIYNNPKDFFNAIEQGNLSI